MKANYFVVLLLYIIVFESCKKESGDVDLKVEYDFSSTDKDLIPILNAYAESYIYGVTDWYNKNHYDLSAFNTIFAVGESNDALQNGYLFLSGSVPYDGDESNPIDLSVNLQATGSKAVRMNDPVLLIEATKDLKDGQVFTKYQKYLVFLVNNELIDGIERAGMASIIDFFYHEGYHLFPQENLRNPMLRTVAFVLTSPKTILMMWNPLP